MSASFFTHLTGEWAAAGGVGGLVSIGRSEGAGGFLVVENGVGACFFVLLLHVQRKTHGYTCICVHTNKYIHR